MISHVDLSCKIISHALNVHDLSELIPDLRIVHVFLFERTQFLIQMESIFVAIGKLSILDDQNIVDTVMRLQILFAITVIQTLDTPVFTVEINDSRTGLLRQESISGKKFLLPAVLEEQSGSFVTAVA